MRLARDRAHFQMCWQSGTLIEHHQSETALQFYLAFTKWFLTARETLRLAGWLTGSFVDLVLILADHTALCSAILAYLKAILSILETLCVLAVHYNSREMTRYAGGCTTTILARMKPFSLIDRKIPTVSFHAQPGLCSATWYLPCKSKVVCAQPFKLELGKFYIRYN